MRCDESLRHRDRRRLQHAKIRAVPQTLANGPPNVCILGHQQDRVARSLLGRRLRVQRGRLVARQEVDLESYTRRR